MTEEIPTFHVAKRAFEREYVLRVLREAGGNISEAARIAGKDRKDFYDLMQRCVGSPYLALRAAGVNGRKRGAQPAPEPVVLDDETRKKWGLA